MTAQERYLYKIASNKLGTQAFTLTRQRHNTDKTGQRQTSMPVSTKPTTVPVNTGPSSEGNLCLLCSEQNITCCRTEPYLAPLCFPLSTAEWRRMRPYADLAVLSVPGDGVRFLEEEEAADAASETLHATSPELWELGAMPPVSPEGEPEKNASPPEGGDSICALEPNVPEFIASMHEMFPQYKKTVNALFPTRNKHLTLRLRTDGSCIFLGSKGCRLPRAVRPWYCRIFPAWVVGGSLTLFLLQDCLISHRAKDPADGVRMLGATPNHIRTLHARLSQDWGLNK